MDPEYVQFVTRIHFNDRGVQFIVSAGVGFDEIVAEICKRFASLKPGHFQILYQLEDSVKYLLQSDSDLLLLRRSVVKRNLDEVEFNLEETRTSNSCDSMVVEDGESSISNLVPASDMAQYCRDDFFDEPYRSIGTRPYLSRDWLDLIQGNGQLFRGGATEFREKLAKYSIERGFVHNYIRNSWNRMLVVCQKKSSEGCEWFIRCRIDPVTRYFVISDYNLEHKCSGNLRTMKHKLFRSGIVSTCIDNALRVNPGLKAREIINEMKVVYGYEVDYKTAYRAKHVAQKRIHGSFADSFNSLQWYKRAVEETNPESLFELEIDKENRRFLRVFVAYGACINGFEYCVPLLFIDGTHGKTMYKGQILAATGINGNQEIYPLAVAFCDSENEDNWTWFFENLKKILDKQERMVTFMSDRHHGLIKAKKKVFPDNPHSYCFFHLRMNLADKIGGGEQRKQLVEFLFMTVAWSPTEEHYHRSFAKLRDVAPDVVDKFFDGLEKEHYCDAFFNGNRYGEITNSLAESFNNWIKFERQMPVYEMLDCMRLKLMTKMYQRWEASHKWPENMIMCPKMEKKLAQNMDEARSYAAYPGNHAENSLTIQLVGPKYDHSCDIMTMKCSCGRWIIDWFPCPHALAAIQSMCLNVYNYVSVYHTKDYYQKSYAEGIVPISNVEKYYDELQSDSVVLAPITKVQPGRPKGKRIKSKGERSEKKEIRCGRCHQLGHHNQATCSRPI